MGGRGSGGRRVGAGRKPKDAHLRAIQGGLSRRPDAPPPEQPAATAAIAEVEPPADLTAGEMVIWQREAPFALKERTLTPATAGAFRELCELEALKNQMLARIKTEMTTLVETKLGLFEKAHPLLTHYRGAVQRLSTFRKDFKLAPFGKELLQADPDTKAEPQQKRAYW